ncbi:hypothetical protein SLEP1_g28575 [Rubroshorea leprosula]|uniref:Uncharacterized protein n=1 Tax=Rubroshorea leprosula TaxID=152421 RepID=A0AAV5K2R7_9ROSI|nr:hypothetical protein SLEP1_g28575 [Rubroshorea leprosula]
MNVKSLQDTTALSAQVNGLIGGMNRERMELSRVPCDFSFGTLENCVWPGEHMLLPFVFCLVSMFFIESF